MTSHEYYQYVSGKTNKRITGGKGLLQRQLAAELEIDSPMYSKIERGERRAKREQVIKLAKMLNTDKNELLTLWLAGQVYEIIKDEEMGQSALEMLINKQNSKF